MGDRHDTVTVPGFWMDLTEVTVAEYRACGTCTDPSTYNSCNAGLIGKDNHPVNCVDWAQATAYCAAVGKRLPTEEEWEWAARGGVRGGLFPWGNDAPAAQLCWKKTGTCPVGGYPQGDNPQGIHDLAGNVYEWTASKFSSALGSGTVNRGGAWYDSNPDFMRADRRGSDQTDFRNSGLGFRCARTP